MTRIRTRHLNEYVPFGTYHDWITPGSPATSPFYADRSRGYETIYDENHGMKWTQGGEMHLERVQVQRTPSEQATIYRPNHTGPDSGRAYVGQLTAKEPTYGDLPDGYTLAYDFGADLYNLAKPDRPIFSGLNAFYELKDVPAMLKQRFLTHLNLGTIGNLYLAYQFGWAQLLRDMFRFTLAHMKLQRAFEQFLRDEGKPVRRTARLKTVTYGPSPSGYHSYNGFEQSFVTPVYRTVPFVMETHRSIYDVWFSGRFRYWLPNSSILDPFGGRGYAWQTMMIARIYGFNPTPASIYRMIPWTWLADWFTNAGNVLENMQTTVVDRLACDYGYVMAHGRDENEIQTTGRFLTGNDWDGPASTFKATTTLVRENKWRVTCDPFSFHYTGETLSDSQSAILGALALSRGNRDRFRR